MSEPRSAAGPDWRAQEERSNLFALRLIVWIARHLGRTVARAFLWPISFYFWATAPKARQASAKYLRHVETALNLAPNTLSTFQHILTFSQMLLDRVYMLSGESARFNTFIHNFDEMKGVHARHEGGLFIGAHLGSFEALRVLGTEEPSNHQRLPELVVRMAMFDENARKINAMLEAINPDATQGVISLGRPDAMLELQDTIARGEFVGMLADRHLGAGGGAGSRRAVEFLGEQALFPTGPFRLALVLKRPVYLMFGMYRGGNKYEIFFEELPLPDAAKRTEQLALWQQAYVKRLEHFCMLAPYNWFNFFDFWTKDAEL